MASQDQSKSFPQPGLFSSLSNGFEAIANNIAVILIPIAIDIFIWLGPRLRIQTFMQPIIESWTLLVKEDLFAADVVKQAQDLWYLFIENFNLLSFVRTFPVGVPSLITGLSPTDSPLGKGLDHQLASMGQLFSMFILVLLAGCVLGGFYLHWVSYVTLRKNRSMLPFRSIFWTTGQAFLVMLFWAVFLMLLAVPGMLILMVFTLISPILAQFFYILVMLMSLWLAMPIFFSTHGIFVYGQGAIASIMQALKMVRFTLPTTSLLLISMFVISQGLAYLWRTPAETSWLMLVGIAGHAFISTALMAGSFIYYRDTNAWLQVMLERLKSQASSRSAQV